MHRIRASASALWSPGKKIHDWWPAWGFLTSADIGSRAKIVADPSRGISHLHASRIGVPRNCGAPIRGTAQLDACIGRGSNMTRVFSKPGTEGTVLEKKALVQVRGNFLDRMG